MEWIILHNQQFLNYDLVLKLGPEVYVSRVEAYFNEPFLSLLGPKWMFRTPGQALITVI